MGEKITKEYQFFIYAVNCYALQVLWRFMLPKLFWVIRSLISGSPLRKSPVSLSINSSVSSILCLTDNFNCFLTFLLQNSRSSWLTRKCKCHVNPFPIIQLCDILFSVKNPITNGTRMALGMAQLQIDRKKDAHCTIMVLINLCNLNHAKINCYYTWLLQVKLDTTNTT